MLPTDTFLAPPFFRGGWGDLNVNYGVRYATNYYFSAELGCKNVTLQQPSRDSISSATSIEECHNCPIDCPNRKPKPRQPVLGGGYIFALIVAVLLALQCLDASFKRVHGEDDFLFATKSPPSALLIAGLTLIGLGLGIEIDKRMISSSAKGLLTGLVNSSKSEEDSI
jgi:hypothetical protein